MKTDINGVSQCQKGCENYERFTHRRKTFYQYEYRAEDGELFTCVKPTLSECRKARDEHFKPVVVVYTPEQLRAKGLTAKLQSICGNIPIRQSWAIRWGLTATLSGSARIKIG